MNTTVYTGRATNWTSVVASVVLLVPLLVLASDGAALRQTDMAVLALVLLGVAAEVATASDVRVSAGPHGVSFHWGFVGWPRATYRLEDIADASVVDVPWWAVAFGLWWTPRRTVCTVRSGPALRLRLTNGRRVTVTVPDPHAAVAALRE
jgi:hypothetical protein